MKTRQIAIGRVVPTLALFGLLGLSGDTQAAHWFNAGATFCTHNSGYIGDNYASDAFHEGGFVTGAHLTCPLYEREGLERTAIDVVNVHLRDGSHSDHVTVQVCRRSYSGGSASCGVAESSTDNFVGGITWTIDDLDTTAWFWSSGFAYFAIELGEDSVFRGYRIKNS